MTDQPSNDNTVEQDPPAGRRALRAWWPVMVILAGFVMLAVVVILRDPALQPNDDDEGQVPTTTPVARLTKPAPAAQGFVGSAACAECHPKIAADYQTHPMAQSLFPVEAAPPVENYAEGTSFAPTPSRLYRVEKDGDHVVHVEEGRDAQGKAVYEQTVPVHYALGSGRRGRSYVINRGGWLYLSPVSWYSEGQRWDLSPGYEPEGHPRFSRRAAERCLQCHVGRLAHRKRSSDDFQRYAKPPFLEHGIGCERCHGPGQQHVDLRKPGMPVINDPIVNPVHLTPAKRDAVCNQCHLQGEYQILRYGRTDDDFRPGDHLGDIWSIFVDAEESANKRNSIAVSHVDQMHGSKCYLASRGKLGCISCHDPHRLPDENDKRAFYRQRCLACHQDQGCALPLAEQDAAPASGSCIACHMPRFGASDIPHTSQTDHRILRAPSSEPAPSMKESDNATFRIFDGGVTKMPAIEEARAQGLVLARRAEGTKNERLAEDAEKLLLPVMEAAPDDLAVLDALAICSVLQGDTSAAVQRWNKILAIEPQNLQALFSLTVAHHQLRRYGEARDFAERYLAFNPWPAELHGRFSDILANSGQIEFAIESAERARELDPSVVATYALLETLYRRNGDQEKADELQRLLLRMQEL